MRNPGQRVLSGVAEPQQQRRVYPPWPAVPGLSQGCAGGRTATEGHALDDLHAVGTGWHATTPYRFVPHALRLASRWDGKKIPYRGTWAGYNATLCSVP